MIDTVKKKPICFAFSEGLALSNYQFLKYLTNKKEYSLKTINLCASMQDTDAEELQAIINGTFVARDLVNEPLSYLNAIQYSKDIEAYGKKFGFTVEVLHKKKIEALKMGGLLAVNQGSIDPPTFKPIDKYPISPLFFCTIKTPNIFPI